VKKEVSLTIFICYFTKKRLGWFD